MSAPSLLLVPMVWLHGYSIGLYDGYGVMSGWLRPGFDDQVGATLEGYAILGARLGTAMGVRPGRLIFRGGYFMRQCNECWTAVGLALTLVVCAAFGWLGVFSARLGHELDGSMCDLAL
jgi:hypothetical protein